MDTALAPLPVSPHSDASRLKAEEKLIESLTPAQRESFRDKGVFHVTSLQSGTVYLIDCHIIGNVMRLDSREHFCCHLRNAESFPLSDHLLAQALMIRYSEKEFLAIARRI